MSHNFSPNWQWWSHKFFRGKRSGCTDSFVETSSSAPPCPVFYHLHFAKLIQIIWIMHVTHVDSRNLSANNILHFVCYFHFWFEQVYTSLHVLIFRGLVAYQDRKTKRNRKVWQRSLPGMTTCIIMTGYVESLICYEFFTRHKLHSKWTTSQS